MTSRRKLLCWGIVICLPAAAIALGVSRTEDFWRGSPTRSITVSGSPVLAVAFSPDGRVLATSDGRGMVRLWDPDTGAELCGWQAHDGFATTLAFSPDGALLATGGSDRTAALWRVGGHDIKARLEGHTGPVTSVSFSPDGRTLTSWAVGFDRDKPVSEARRRWDTESGAEVTPVSVPVTPRAFAASRDGKTIAVTEGPSVLLRAAGTNDPLATISGHPDQINAAAFSPNGRLLATSGGSTAASCEHPVPWKNGDVRVWDVRTGAMVARFHRHWQPVMGVAFSPDGRTLASASYDGTVKLWDVSGLGN